MTFVKLSKFLDPHIPTLPTLPSINCCQFLHPYLNQYCGYFNGFNLNFRVKWGQWKVFFRKSCLIQFGKRFFDTSYMLNILYPHFIHHDSSLRNLIFELLFKYFISKIDIKYTHWKSTTNIVLFMNLEWLMSRWTVVKHLLNHFRCY